MMEGSSHWAAKFHTVDLDFIFHLKSLRMKQKHIAHRMGVNQCTISEILTGRSYTEQTKHLRSERVRKISQRGRA